FLIGLWHMLTHENDWSNYKLFLQWLNTKPYAIPFFGFILQNAVTSQYKEMTSGQPSTKSHSQSSINEKTVNIKIQVHNSNVAKNYAKSWEQRSRKLFKSSNFLAQCTSIKRSVINLMICQSKANYMITHHRDVWQFLLRTPFYNLSEFYRLSNIIKN
ncbi:hypothetical protein GJ496_008169, partial [Pomphorhynchus laevis]